MNPLDHSPLSAERLAARWCLGTRRLLAIVWALGMLHGCGGAAGDAPAPPPTARLPELSGRVTDGTNVTDVPSLQVTIKGNVGTARTAEGRLASVDGADYLASLDQLTGPYLLTNSANASGPGLYAVATGPGTANLTLLTTLLVADLLATEPGPYFASLGARGGFTEADEAAMAHAEARVRRHLQRELGFVVPPDLGPFVTTRFERSAGDPMHDTVTALAARLGTADDFSALVTAVAQESARCRVEKLTLSDAADVLAGELCPQSKRRDIDPQDASLQVLDFLNQHGDRLSLRLRNGTVSDLSWTTAEGQTSRCSASDCSGITLARPAADRSQVVTFAETPVRGPGGLLRIRGSLRAAAPGVALPGLPCTTNRYYLVDETAGSAEGYCATPDDFGLGAAGQSAASGASRRVYTFRDDVGGPSLEVVIQGRAVVRILVYSVDELGRATARYQCRDGGCTDAQLDSPTVDTSLGVSVVLQPLRFARTRLAAVLPDGSLSATQEVALEGSFTGWHIEDSAAPPLLPVGCPVEAAAVLALASDEAAPTRICEPEDAQGFQLSSTSIDAEGHLVLSLSNLLSDGLGSYTAANTLSVTISPGGQLLSITYDPLNGPRFGCDVMCSGVVVAAANERGERTVSFNATVLQEAGTAGLVADRTATLQGRMLAPAPP